jgi:hypothetical protein
VPDGSVDANAALKNLAQDVYIVQEDRYRSDGILTARTDHPLSKPPNFLYDSIFAAGYPWNTISEQGKTYGQLALVSTRAAFGMWVLWDEPYTDVLMRAVEWLFDPQRGWYEGRYESSGAVEDLVTLSTNAVVLESLLYKVDGALYRQVSEPSYLQHRLSDVFTYPKRCFAPERPVCGPVGR